MKSRSEPSHELLLRYVDGEITPSEQQSIESHLADCHACEKKLASYRHIVAGLGQPSEDLRDLDLVPDLQRDLRAPRPRPRPPWFSWRPLTLAASLVLAVPALVYLAQVRRREPLGDEGVRLKSTGSVDDRWAGLQVYALRVDEQPRRLGKRLKSRTGLLYAYNNLGESPFAYLMVFAVDFRGRVHWSYPAHRNPSLDPGSIEIQPTASAVELPDLVHHDYAEGALAIFGLFTRSPRRVSEVESLVSRLRRDGSWPGSGERLPIPNSAQQIILTEVER